MAETQAAVPPDTGRLLFEIKKVIVGQDHLIERLMVGLLARGHLLVEHVGVEGQERRHLDDRDRDEVRAIRCETAGQLDRAVGFRGGDERHQEAPIPAQDLWLRAPTPSPERRQALPFPQDHVARLGPTVLTPTKHSLARTERVPKNLLGSRGDSRPQAG